MSLHGFPRGYRTSRSWGTTLQGTKGLQGISRMGRQQGDTNSLSIPFLWIPHSPTLQLLTRPNPSPNFPHNPILYSRIESFRSRPASSHYRLQSATTFADTNVHSSDHVETQVPKDIRAHPQVKKNIGDTSDHLYFQVCSLKTLLRPSSEEERRGAGRR